MLNIDWHAWLNTAAVPLVLLALRWVWSIRVNHLTHMENDIKEIKGLLLDHLKDHSEHPWPK